MRNGLACLQLVLAAFEAAPQSYRDHASNTPSCVDAQGESVSPTSRVAVAWDVYAMIDRFAYAEFPSPTAVSLDAKSILQDALGAMHKQSRDLNPLKMGVAWGLWTLRMAVNPRVGERKPEKARSTTLHAERQTPRASKPRERGTVKPETIGWED